MSTEPPPLREDELLDRLEDIIAAIVVLDVPEMPEPERCVLVGHLTGAVYVTVRNAR